MNEVSAHAGTSTDAIVATASIRINEGQTVRAGASVWRDATGHVRVDASASVEQGPNASPEANAARQATPHRCAAPIAKPAWWRRQQAAFRERRRLWWEEDLRPFAFLNVLRDVVRTTLVFGIAFLLLGVYVRLAHPDYLENKPLPEEVYAHINALFSIPALLVELCAASALLVFLSLVPFLRRHTRVVADHVITAFCSAAAFYAVFMTFSRVYNIPGAASVAYTVGIPLGLVGMALVCAGTMSAVADTVVAGLRKKHL